MFSHPVSNTQRGRSFVRAALALRTCGSWHGVILLAPLAPSPFCSGCGCPQAGTASRARPRELGELQPFPPVVDFPALEPLLGLWPVPSLVPHPQHFPVLSAERRAAKSCGHCLAVLLPRAAAATPEEGAVLVPEHSASRFRWHEERGMHPMLPNPGWPPGAGNGLPVPAWPCGPPGTRT